MLNSYIVTNLGNTNEWVISQNGAFIGEYSSLANALAYLASHQSRILNYRRLAGLP